MRHPYRVSLIAVALVAAATAWLTVTPAATHPADRLGRDAGAVGPGSSVGEPLKDRRDLILAARREPAPASSAPARSAQADRTRPGADRSGPADAAGVSQEAREEQEPPRAVAPLHLLAADRTRPAALQRADGLDLEAPRDLTLWRVDPETGRAAALAATRSGTDGRFTFERLLLPDAGATLVVAPIGADPNGPAASVPLDSSRRVPPPPPAWVVAEGEAGLRVRVAAGPGATVWVSPAARLQPQRIDLQPTNRGAQQGAPIGLPEFRLPELEDGEGWVVSQSLPDGRHSEWRPITPARARARGNQTYNEGDGA